MRLASFMHFLSFYLRRELRQAIEVAVLGPELDPAHHDGVRLPSEFEAEERAHASASQELLHVVHGRQVLGKVLTADRPLPVAGSSAQGRLPAGEAGRWDESRNESCKEPAQ